MRNSRISSILKNFDFTLTMDTDEKEVNKEDGNNRGVVKRKGEKIRPCVDGMPLENEFFEPAILLIRLAIIAVEREIPASN